MGKPYVLGDDSDVAAPFESKCPVEITGLYARRHALIGGGTLQALLSGVQVLGILLHGFIEQGGRILDATDESELDMTMWFGPLFCAPPKRVPS